MTVCAFDGKTLACDSQVSSGGQAWASVRKIRRIKGWIVGAAGTLDGMTTFLKKFNPDNINNHDKIGAAADLEAIMISPEGVIHYMEGTAVATKIKTEGFIAIGSGAIEAMAAMSAGANAVEAVKIAIKYNKTCGGKVHKLELR